MSFAISYIWEYLQVKLIDLFILFTYFELSVNRREWKWVGVAPALKIYLSNI